MSEADKALAECLFMEVTNYDTPEGDGSECDEAVWQDAVRNVERFREHLGERGLVILSREPTRQQIANAAQAMWREDTAHTDGRWSDEEPGVREWYRGMATFALRAALSAGEEETR